MTPVRFHIATTTGRLPVVVGVPLLGLLFLVLSSGSCSIRPVSLYEPFGPSAPIAPRIDLAEGKVAQIWGIGTPVNSADEESYPWISQDGRRIYFFRHYYEPIDTVFDRWGEQREISRIFGRLYFSESTQSGSYVYTTTPIALFEGTQGAGGLTTAGGRAIYSHCKTVKGRFFCDLYEGSIEALHDTNSDHGFRILSELETESWDAHPALDREGRTLYFVRDNLRGRPDIYVSRRTETGLWDSPAALPYPINTRHTEFDPYLSPDGNHLFFSSNRHGGFGGLDLYVCIRQEDSTWSEPFNIGEPFNSRWDDTRLVMAPDGETYFFCSERRIEGAMGGSDIYAVRIVDSVDAW